MTQRPSDYPLATIAREDDGRVSIHFPASAPGWRLSPNEALQIGRLLMGAAGFPAYQHDEPWATMDRAHRARLAAEKAAQS